MVALPIADLTDGLIANPLDRIPIARSPYLPGNNNFITPGYIIRDLAREKLLTDRNYFVRKDGNDTNTGMVNDAGGAFLTIQKAIDVIGTLDLSVFNIALSIGDGTYDEILILYRLLGAGAVTVTGNMANASLCVVKPTTNPFGAGVLLCYDAASWSFRGMTFDSTDAGFGGLECITVYGSLASLQLNTCLIKQGGFAAAKSEVGAQLAMHNCTMIVTGSHSFGFYVYTGARLALSGTISLLSGTPDYTFAFLFCDQSAIAIVTCIFSGWGVATGPRLWVKSDSGVYCNSAGTNYIPGSTHGEIDTTSWYFPGDNSSFGSALISGVPSVTTVPIPGNWIIARDSLSGLARVSLNDAGTMKYLTFAGLLTPDADGRTITAAESGATYTNEGATAIAPFILPSAVAGLTYSFIVQDADGIRVTAATGDTIRLAANVSAAAGKIEATAVGNAVTLMAINAIEWVATRIVGAWTVT